MIKAIVFDCFGVLTADLWKEFQATQPPDKVKLIRGIHWAFDKRQISYPEFQAQIAAVTGASAAELDNIFLVDTDRSKNQPLFLFINQLKQTYKIGLLSNVGTAWVREEFLTTEERQLFDVMVLSYEVGYAKPESEIFDLTAQRLGFQPEECLLIDDSEANCLGAQKRGWQTITYQNWPQLKNDLQAKYDIK